MEHGRVGAADPTMVCPDKTKNDDVLNALDRLLVLAHGGLVGAKLGNSFEKG